VHEETAYLKTANDLGQGIEQCFRQACRIWERRRGANSHKSPVRSYCGT